MCGAANDCDGTVNIVNSVDLMEEACLFYGMEQQILEVSIVWCRGRLSVFVRVRLCSLVAVPFRRGWFVEASVIQGVSEEKTLSKGIFKNTIGCRFDNRVLNV